MRDMFSNMKHICPWAQATMVEILLRETSHNKNLCLMQRYCFRCSSSLEIFSRFFKIIIIIIFIFAEKSVTLECSINITKGFTVFVLRNLIVLFAECLICCAPTLPKFLSKNTSSGVEQTSNKMIHHSESKRKPRKWSISTTYFNYQLC